VLRQAERTGCHLSSRHYSGRDQRSEELRVPHSLRTPQHSGNAAQETAPTESAARAPKTYEKC